MKTTATNPNYDCLPEYTQLGWVPFDKEKESVSKSLEYAYDDYCIARVAEKLGKMDDYHFFMKRALSYKNLIDPETKYMRGRDSQGNWRSPFSPMAGGILQKGLLYSTLGMCLMMFRGILMRQGKSYCEYVWILCL